jgi:hypothetical protein
VRERSSLASGERGDRGQGSDGPGLKRLRGRGSEGRSKRCFRFDEVGGLAVGEFGRGGGRLVGSANVRLTLLERGLVRSERDQSGQARTKPIRSRPTLSSLASASSFSRFVLSFSSAFFASSKSLASRASLFFSPFSSLTTSPRSFSTSTSSSPTRSTSASSSTQRSLACSNSRCNSRRSNLAAPSSFLSEAMPLLESLRDAASSDRRDAMVDSDALNELRRIAREAESAKSLVC